MLRRIASLGFEAPDGQPGDRESMPPIPGDASPSSESKSTGGLASVFKGLTGGSRISKAPPVPSSSNAPASALLSSERVNTASLAATGVTPHYNEWLDKLKSGTLSERIAAADSLRLTLPEYPLAPVLQVWDAAKDLVEASRPSAVRAAGWELMAECAKNTAITELERKEYFQTLSGPANPDDSYLRLGALVDLTNHGRNISGFDYDIIPLLTTWLADAYNTAKHRRRQTRGEKKSSKGKAAAPSDAPVAAEDKLLSLLVAYIIEVLKFNFRVADDDVIGRLIDTLLDICTKTTVEEDLICCIEVIDAVITYGSVPKRTLGRCVEILSSIYCLVSDLQKTAWHTLANLLKSHNGQATVRVLLSLLRDYPRNGHESSEAFRIVRGSLSVLQKLVGKSSEKGYPTVPLALLIDGCNNVIGKSQTRRIAGPTLKLINTLFNDGTQKLNPLLEDEDWTLVLEVAEKCVGRLPSDTEASRSRLSLSSEGKKGDIGPEELEILLRRLEVLVREGGSDFIQRQECIAFLTRIPHVLLDSTAALVLDHFKEFRCCYPSDLDWEANLSLVLDFFFLDRSRSTAVRIQALQAVTEVYDMLELVEDELEEECVPNLVEQILSGISEEADTLVLQETVSFMISVAVSAEVALFEHIIDTLNSVIAGERRQSLMAPPPSETPGSTDEASNPQSPADVVTRGFVLLFLKTMNTDSRKASVAFNLLVEITRSAQSTDARLTAMKLLFRLRADWANRIYVISFTESEGLAGVLHRTEASLARKLAEDAATLHRSKSEHAGNSRAARGVSFGTAVQDRMVPSRTASSVKHGASRYHQLWSLPDADALPETPSSSASPVLFSHVDMEVQQKDKTLGDGADVGADQDEEEAVHNKAPLFGNLRITSWLDAILHNLTSGGADWEIYSFCLVHLPSQLSNHALFRDAITQIREARRIMCEQSKHNLFQDPPPATGLRRPEVNICIFQALTTIMSYHQDFTKSEDDDLVRTFLQGIGHSTAKTCIHALTICCHEMPLATTRALVNILQKMSTVITQPYVAVHILEFLAGLARLPALYSNFIDDDFRIIFGMCFRYLDTVRDKKRYARNSYSGENVAATINATHEYNMLGQPTISDDLPQYVYALAYHVISFWFLALRLTDRAKHVNWIAKRLFQGPDGGLTSDEQALITMDFLQRVAYADADDSAESPWFTEAKRDEYTEKRWIVANSLVSIKQAKSTPWAQVTRRQPSGTSYFTVRENFRAPPPHQAGSFGERKDRASLTTNSSLPSHLLVHMLSSIPQSPEAVLRPIPLPDEEAVARSIKIFDRISTVDGHKVGIIYIGENQTSESEILQNVSGSADYVEFLNGIGMLTKLKGAEFNTQGLDREFDTDGQYTFCWRDRVTEMVFHVITQMPTNLEYDPQCIQKKKHIGNDFVNIIFNDSGLPFKFDTFPSEFNYVYIVITPESRASFTLHGGPNEYSPFFKVQVMSKEGFPEISPCAATKMVDLKALPDFVRLLALNASVFSLVWANRESGEYPSSWRSRLREINRLRERYAPKGLITSTSTMPGQTSGHPPPPQQQVESRPSSGLRDSTISGLSGMRRASVATFLTSTSEPNSQSHRSSVLSTATADTEMVMPPSNLDYVVESLDFSKWA
ncbi:hypothetical protein M406DRAFT_286113 [Cryphonectria parasitica EP155]|uniref:Rap-GAP domain-containing protein n=1 Tax=Cryphonectria parasitica (strain ATCC 38755 / EP155) TaxID=660469 RepID=A0A9P5CWQ8_CRYP1|nr:uncharacterized protein M406DRAFT_286113 [Cryphonectria parasitica EP155]KAF3771230.1 hypothetical protein M406DRAFT_286113 [Cryphonectria parasitica EP155]